MNTYLEMQLKFCLKRGIKMISKDYTKSEDMSKEMFKTVSNISMQVQETTDEFIFSVLSDFASNNYNMVLDKKELVMAIQFIRMCNETGTDLRQYHNTATNLTDLYAKGYNDGFKVGIQKVRNRLEEDFKL